MFGLYHSIIYHENVCIILCIWVSNTLLDTFHYTSLKHSEILHAGWQKIVKRMLHISRHEICQQNYATAVYEAKNLAKRTRNSQHLLICNKSAEMEDLIWKRESCLSYKYLKRLIFPFWYHFTITYCHSVWGSEEASQFKPNGSELRLKRHG